jgi:hypothetical protein
MIDGMSIRKQLIYDQRKQRMEGYVDLGSGPQDDEGEASEALVFMVTGTIYIENLHSTVCFLKLLLLLHVCFYCSAVNHFSFLTPLAKDVRIAQLELLFFCLPHARPPVSYFLMCYGRIWSLHLSL